ncbi:TetR/AcrR family transcriptional regulator [Nonomuraea sp. NPDC049419]|uniref:TetR/AcrR family transcriptional regulator n=1 Tax=Nonomuraea sp. NPDC049419 TaxID=3155772 RepID=UPI00344026DD
MASPSSSEPPAAGRPVRAHARRNRENLLAVARAAFATADGPVSLEGIAKQAGVGIGTLYRHFPTREALVEAVYSAELDDVTGCVPDLLAAHPPEVAMRVWMERYGAFVSTKRAMLDTLRTGWASGRLATPTTRERITAAIGAILESGARAGTLRGDVEASDVTSMILGVFLSTAAGDTWDRMDRLFDLLLDALQPRQG